MFCNAEIGGSICSLKTLAELQWWSTGKASLGCGYIFIICTLGVLLILLAERFCHTVFCLLDKNTIWFYKTILWLIFRKIRGRFSGFISDCTSILACHFVTWENQFVIYGVSWMSLHVILTKFNCLILSQRKLPLGVTGK